ncbi:MAG: type I pantothenate kinase [Arcanobacterium sp.]|nr:type I pantothenate kinase [Arcanobacterium sp.]
MSIASNATDRVSELRGKERGTFVTISSEKWRSLASSTELPLTDADVRALAALGDPIGIAEADAVYRPLSALMQMYARHIGALMNESHSFLGLAEPRTPWIIGIAGSVAVGKSTAARLLRELMRRWPQTPRVDLVTTDGFLRPNAVLAQQGLMGRKGFPESYDRHALLDFLSAVKAGEGDVLAPVYDHISYDIVPGKFVRVNHPDVLIVEGLNVLQPPRMSSTDGEFRAVSDYFDFSIYLDAPEDSLEKWYVERFHKLRTTAFTDERSYFRSYAGLSYEEADAIAHEVWRTINLPNLRENVAPTRTRATVILTKGPDHAVQNVHLRKL